jgi:hypothetical protein
MEKYELLLFLFYSLFRVKQSNHMMTLGLIDHDLFKKKDCVCHDRTQP